MPIGSGTLPWATAASLIDTIRVLDKEGLKFQPITPVGSSVVQWARSSIVGAFLKTDCTHLFWIDSDIAWRPDDFFRILGFGAHHDLVGASYPLKKEPLSFLINLDLADGKAQVNGLGCVKIKSMAIGFTLVKRAVLETLAKKAVWVDDKLNGNTYPDLFRVDRTKNGPRGEDVAFFDDARAAGFEAWLDPSIELGHEGRKIYRGSVTAALGLQDFLKEIPR